jgi:hypothetical protein
MAEDHTVTLQITVTKGGAATPLAFEQTGFSSISFARMTHISAEFFELISKLQKEKT